MADSSTLTIATRRSALAMWQTRHVAERLSAADDALDIGLLPLSTHGDRVVDRPLAEIGGKGLFLKELEAALLDRRADIAVHSLKDMPAQMPVGLTIGAILAGEDWSDWWLGSAHRRPPEAAPGTRVGTSSLRRSSQLLRLNPELVMVPVRGNVETRLRLLAEGRVDALVLAAAGLKRLGLIPGRYHPLGPPHVWPAPGQGVIAVQCRADDLGALARLAAIECSRTRRRIEAERGVVAELGGDCRMPLAALAVEEAGRLTLTARLLSADGRQCLETTEHGPLSAAAQLGHRAGRTLLRLGASELLSQM